MDWIVDNLVAIVSAIIAIIALEVARRSYNNSLKQTQIAEKALAISKEAKEASNRSAVAAEKSADVAEISSKATEISAKTAEKALREGFRPYVVVKLFCLDTILHFEIVNLGNRTAKDVTVTINPSFDDLLPLKTFNNAVRGVAKLYNQKFISAVHSLTTLLAKNEEYLELNKGKETDVRIIEIKYNSVDFTPLNEKKIEFEDKYEIDIRSFLFAEKVATTSDNRQLGKVTTELKKMNTSLNNISASLSNNSNNLENDEPIN
jgi:hypothetical protein